MKESELERIEYTDFGLGAIETVQSIGTLLEMTMKETKKLSCTIPKRKESYYTVKKEIILHARDQYTIEPNIKH
ncbi:hypothetical protein FNP23_000232 [Enterococcus faecium]|uniref:hypothetical protein n=1 Tax=Enterococcus faecium TaxID=1352 RepID=UPI000666F0A9|nr:hypothetical protein [Enterococcus faecium]EGP4819727.1 hypothetical protein [Enterococcus faecium]